MFDNNLFNVDTKKWCRAAAVRAVKTFAQACIALIPAAVTITEVDWKTVLGSAVLAAIVSLLTSVLGIPEVENE